MLALKYLSATNNGFNLNKRKSTSVCHSCFLCDMSDMLLLGVGSMPRQWLVFLPPQPDSAAPPQHVCSKSKAQQQSWHIFRGLKSILVERLRRGGMRRSKCPEFLALYQKLTSKRKGLRVQRAPGRERGRLSSSSDMEADMTGAGYPS